MARTTIRRLALITATTALATGAASLTTSAFAAPATPQTTATAVLTDDNGSAVGGDSNTGGDATPTSGDNTTVSGEGNENGEITVKPRKLVTKSSPAIHVGGNQAAPPKLYATKMSAVPLYMTDIRAGF
ncbi:hypothetical protein [Streptomyces sp. NPDC006463]|uniref:hypothetical protein n=1 Tax=Streptomyces sp. NPDC006463 TaxID=3364746 RepID=UPI0036B901EC